MKSALIDIPSTLVVQVEPLGQTFPVDSAHEWVDCPDDITAGNYTYSNGQFILVPQPEPVPPTPPTAEENKQAAIGRLERTDWLTIPDVSDPTKSNPYLSNVQEFVVWRNAVRQYAINPVAGNIDWPVKPTEVWTTV
jgi:hypothetical protein